MVHRFRHQRSSQRSPEVEKSTRGVLRAFALLGLFLLYFPIDMWLGTISETEAPIGAVKSVSAASGALLGLTVLETATGFYVLRGYANIQKGTPLILDSRLNGNQYVCDVGKSVCVRSSSRQLSAAGGQLPPQPRPGASNAKGDQK